MDRKIYPDRNLCEKECPPGYKSNETSICEKCDGPCPKICELHAPIQNLEQIQMMEGCTIINKTLEINILDDIQHVEEELVKYLGQVEEINGYLKIHR